ncbi:SNF2-rel-dom domain-containing protein [Fusarium keratoplasticum]|uniref:SNF2-rel-dom domain-containing protein n=1 Tax=Fusarium keratoplasticum TaxID=1328300 RepID=A0ACC0QUF0_9HYPO|nr:SNF2-rel-dom domain-containing protein [Fusarium keratoplasticum]KAI8666779.1 SNF2-rel-dom domain-containing protein [Fusarium keratoplasticum]
MARLLGQDPESLDLMRHKEFAVQPSLREEMLRQEFIAYVQGGRGPLFLLHPQLFQTLANKIKYGAIFAQTAIRPLMKLLCIRRGMLTRLELPDKSVVSPGDSLPVSASRVVTFRYALSNARQVTSLCQRHFGDLLSQSGEHGSEHIGHNIFQDAASQVLNGSVLRVLSLLTTNIGFYLLTQSNIRNVKLLGDTEAVKILAEQKLAHFSQTDDTEVGLEDLVPVGEGLELTGLRGNLTSDELRMQTRVNQQARVVPSGDVAERNPVIKTTEMADFSSTSTISSQAVSFLSQLTSLGW